MSPIVRVRTDLPGRFVRLQFIELPRMLCRDDLCGWNDVGTMRIGRSSLLFVRPLTVRRRCLPGLRASVCERVLFRRDVQPAIRRDLRNRRLSLRGV